MNADIKSDSQQHPLAVLFFCLSSDAGKPSLQVAANLVLFGGRTVIRF